MGVHTLFVLSCGFLDDREPGGAEWWIPVPAYLIRSASGKNYLVDTGNPKALIGAGDCQPWYPAPCRIEPSDDPIARIAELGLAPADIDAIIATHFDFDHAGQYDAFGPLGTDVYVQRAHMAAALSDTDRYHPALWRVPGLRWHLIDGDREIEPGLRLLRTDGHAIGHQSLAVETASGWVILAADAIDSQAQIDSRSFKDYVDSVAMSDSIDRLLTLAAELDAPIIFGHDPAQWSRITLSPAPFAIR